MQEKIWSLYLIRCIDNSLYCGITNDVSRRFKEHQNMGAKTAKYLRGKGPLQLVFKQELGNRSKALKIEALLKKLKKSEKEKIVKQQNLSLFIEIQD